jgi:serine/threonine protein kinase
MSLCLGCFEEKKQAVCPICGYDEAAKNRSQALLPPGTVLRRQYIVGRVLGKSGSFGTTYLGYNQTLQTKVAIKEYLPADLVCRAEDGLLVVTKSSRGEDTFRTGIGRFLAEARLLVRFNHPNIVRVMDFFEEYGTGYLVMEYCQGENLAEYFRRQGRELEEQEVLNLFMPVLAGLKELHDKGVIHCDVKPQNIFITSDGRPVLIDFGAALQQEEDRRIRAGDRLATPGFAAYEQYLEQGRLGPWTDVYACAATMYYLLTGSVPEEAPVRLRREMAFFPNDSGKRISPEVRSALAKAMVLQPQERVGSAQEFQDLLRCQTIPLQRRIVDTQRITPVDRTFIATEAKLPAASDRSRPLYKKGSLLAVLAVVLAMLAGSGYWYYRQVASPVGQLSKRGIAYTEAAYFNAVKTNNLEVVKLFLAGGMNSNAVEANTGETPVMAAIESGQSAMVNFLIANGANLSVRDRQGHTPLEYALQQGNTQILKTVMDQLRVTADTRDDKGLTLLEKAIAYRNVTDVKFLIEQGADVNIRNQQGMTALDQALAIGNKPIADLLLAAGGKRNVNARFKVNQLNAIMPSGNGRGFEIDLLGDGIGQRCTLRGDGWFGVTAVISEAGRPLTDFSVAGRGYDRWYAAYLQSAEIPDLIYTSVTQNGEYVRDLKIIGKSGNGTVGVLYDFNANWFRHFPDQAKLAVNGKQLLIKTPRGNRVIEWNGEGFFLR